MEYPTITLAMVKSRNNEYPQQAIDSMNRTIYPDWDENINVDVYENNTKYPAIGFNKLVQKSKGDWILFVGDDDKIARTTPFNYATYLFTSQEKEPNKEIVCVTGNIILFDDKGERRQHLQSCPTGMWSVEYLKKNPFDETLERYVDTEMFVRTMENNKTILYAATDYGYYYRQHENNISYNKFEEKTSLLKEITQRKEQQEKLGGIVG